MNNLLISLTMLFDSIVLFIVLLDLVRKQKQINRIYELLEDFLNLEEQTTQTMSLITRKVLKLELKSTIKKIDEEFENKEEREKKNGRKKPNKRRKK